MLSQYLPLSEHRVFFVEADSDMIRLFKKNNPSAADRIIHQDFLSLDLKKIFAERPFAIIGNFPYNISSQIVFRCIEYRDQVPELVGMFQLEMAKRIIAGKGSKDYGIISVLTQLYYSGEEILQLGPDAFEPPPKVHSAVIRLRRHYREPRQLDQKLFKRIVKTTFGQRRKMLRKTLKAILAKGIDSEDRFFQQRPEQLSVEDFIFLTRFVKKQQKKQ